MNTAEKRMPRALGENLGKKLSTWLDDYAREVEEGEDIQEKLFGLIARIDAFWDFPEDIELLQDTVKRMLSLSFITQKHRKEIEEFFYEYRMND